jgi:hypothetical protein
MESEQRYPKRQSQERAISITKQTMEARSRHRAEKQREVRGKECKKDTDRVTLLVIRDRMVLINNNEPSALFRESSRGFLELSVANALYRYSSSEWTRD